MASGRTSSNSLRATGAAATLKWAVHFFLTVRHLHTVSPVGPFPLCLDPFPCTVVVVAYESYTDKSTHSFTTSPQDGPDENSPLLLPFQLGFNTPHDGRCELRTANSPTSSLWSTLTLYCTLCDGALPAVSASRSASASNGASSLMSSSPKHRMIRQTL